MMAARSCEMWMKTSYSTPYSKPDDYHLNNNCRESLKPYIAIMSSVLSISNRKLTGASGIVCPTAILFTCINLAV